MRKHKTVYFRLIS